MEKQTVRQRRGTWILRGLAIAYIPLLAGHFAFPRLFGWEAQLALLSRENAGLLWCLHACGIFWLASMGAATAWEGWKGRAGQPAFGRGLWLWMAGFYLFRLLAEVPCFGWAADTWFMLVLLAAFVGLYAVAWLFLAPAKNHTPIHRTDAIAALLH